MNISGPAAVAKPEMLFYAPGDLTVTFGMAFIVFCAVQNRHPCIDDQEYSKIEIT
jgi:hypothetical protein